MNIIGVFKKGKTPIQMTCYKKYCVQPVDNNFNMVMQTG